MPAAQRVAALRKTITEGAYAQVPITRLFRQYAKTSGPGKRPVALTLLVRKRETLPVLIDALENGSWGDRFNALLFLQKVGRWKEASEQVLALLKNPEVDWEIRLRAAATAAVLGLTEAREPASNLLIASDREGMRAVCAQSLGMLGGPTAIPSLRQALQDPASRVQIAAGGALGRLGSDAGIQVLLKHSNAGQWALRTRAAEALGLVGTDEAKAKLREMESDALVDVRYAAHIGVARIETREMPEDQRLEKLSGLLAHPNRQVALWAARELVEQHGLAALAAVEQAFDSVSPFVRAELEYQLLRLGQENE